MEAPKVSKVSFIRKGAALDLWEYGEDAYVERALELSDGELNYLGERTYANLNQRFYEKGGKKLTSSGYDIGFVAALTLVEYFEGSVRSLNRGRRRSHIGLPKELNITKEDYLTTKATREAMPSWWERLFSKFGHLR